MDIYIIIIFKDVIVCPSISYNVMSVNDIINNDLNVNFSKNELNNNTLSIFNNDTKSLIMESREKGNLFFIKTANNNLNLENNNYNKELVNIVENDNENEINHIHSDLEKKIIHYRFGHPGS